MAEAIAPVVHGGNRRGWGTALFLHVVGATISAGAFGAFLGAAGGWLGAPWGSAGPIAVAALAVLYAARDLFGLPIPVPSLRRQVPDWWRTYFSPNVAALLYGLGLGIGFLTYLRHGTLVVLTAGAIVSGGPLAGAAVLGAFGLARGIAVAANRSGSTRAALDRVMERLRHLALGRGIRWANGASLVAVGAAAVAAAAGSAGFAPQIVAVILAVVFGWAAAAKIIAPARWHRSLDGYALPPILRPAAAVGVPLAEVGVAGLALWGPTRASALLAIPLLAAFSAGLWRARRIHGDLIPCGCFGRSRRRDVRILLGRNAVLALLAVALAAVAPAAPLAHPSVRFPGDSDVVPAVLALLGAVAGIAALRTAMRLFDGRSRSQASGLGWQDGQR
jgi:hypothetical protein